MFQLPGLHHRVSDKAVSDMFVAPEVLTGKLTSISSYNYHSLLT